MDINNIIYVEAYRVMSAYIDEENGINMKAALEVKTTSFAIPARTPGKVSLGENALKYTIKNVSAGENVRLKAIQTYAKFGDVVYVVQHIKNDILITACKENPENNNYRTIRRKSRDIIYQKMHSD